VPTFKLELYKSKTLSDGRHPVCLRVTHGRMARKVIASASLEEWDSKNSRIRPRSRRDYARVNSDIEDEFNKYETIFLTLKKGNRHWTPEDVFKKQVFYSQGLLANSGHYIEYLKSKLTYSYTSAQASHNKIKAYNGEIPIDQITLRWVNGLMSFLKSDYGNGSNTIKDVIKYIKRVVKYSGAENKVLSEIHLSYTETLKPKLTAEEILSLETVALTGQEHHARNSFLLQYYFWGMRIGDLLNLRQKNVIGDRLVYKATKTGKIKEISISDKAAAILKEYIDDSKWFLLPWIRWAPDDTLSEFENYRNFFSEVKNRTMVINRNLKEVAKKAGIKKNLSTHIARHTFASRGDSVLGGNLEVLQQMLGHSSRAMTERYVNDLRKSDVLDEAAKKIFGI
jgi:integrase/recombinase XerD